MSDSSVIDADAMDRLREWGGGELIDRMIRIFLDHAPERIEQIRSGLDDGDLRETEKGAHSLKSSAGNLGAVHLREVCVRMEDLAVDGKRTEARSLLEEVEEAHREATGALTELLESTERE